MLCPNNNLFLGYGQNINIRIKKNNDEKKYQDDFCFRICRNCGG